MSKCFVLQKGMKAPQAAGKIHGDFEKGFIMAEVMKYTDFKEHNGVEADVKVSLLSQIRYPPGGTPVSIWYRCAVQSSKFDGLQTTNKTICIPGVVN